MKTLTTSVNLGNANRWRVFNADAIESLATLDVHVQLINNGNSLVSEIHHLRIVNGQSESVLIDTGAQSLGAALIRGSNVSTPTGYTDAFAAWKAGSTMSARRDALETWMLSAGVAGANMAGT